MPTDYIERVKALQIDASSESGRPKRRRWLWRTALTLLLFAVAAVVAAVLFEVSSSVPVVGTATARLAGPETGPAIVLQANGYIVPAHKVQVPTKVSGRIAWIGVDKGDRVRAGQVIARIQDAEYRAQLNQARGQLMNAQAREREAVAGYLREDIGEAQASLEQLRAEAKTAASRAGRARELFSSGLISRQDLETEEGRAEALASGVRAAEQRLERFRKGTRSEQIEAWRAQVEQARANSEFFGIQLEDTIIRSPISGTVISRSVEPGEYVSNGYVGSPIPIVTVADLSDLNVEIDISQGDFSRLRTGQRGIITVEAYPGRQYDGVVDSLAPQANRQKATVQVSVKVLNADNLLRPEMNATVAFCADAKETVNTGVLIPATAVRDGTVLVVDGGILRAAPVRGSEKPDGVFRAEAGLQPGDLVVLRPSAQLKAGQRVKAIGSSHE